MSRYVFKGGSRFESGREAIIGMEFTSKPNSAHPHGERYKLMEIKYHKGLYTSPYSKGLFAHWHRWIKKHGQWSKTPSIYSEVMKVD